jgi:hypothetical protein
MTDSPDEYGELLRRALSAEANSVVPSPDGLEIIRARVERRGLRGLMWWRTGASVAGAVLVVATVVMVVPQFREQVSVGIGEVNYADTTPPADGSATSRPPSSPPPSNAQPPPASRPAIPPPLPTPSRSVTPSVRPTPKLKPTPKPTPSPTCPTTANEPVEPEETSEKCEETETPTPTPTPTLQEPTIPSENPCPIEECPPPDSPPMPTEASTPVTAPLNK